MKDIHSTYHSDGDSVMKLDSVMFFFTKLKPHSSDSKDSFEVIIM